MTDRRSTRWHPTPLILVVVALIGSVAIPARQTWRISELLRGSTQVLAPTRLLTTQLHGDLAQESSLLQRYLLTGDTVHLTVYRSTLVEENLTLDSLERLASRLDPASALAIRAARSRLLEWRQLETELGDRLRSRDALAAGMAAAQPRYDAAIAAMDVLATELAMEAATRDNRVQELEHVSLVWNAGLVIAAFAALYGVIALMVRERRALRDSRHRERREIALRQAAEALASAFTVEEVTQRIAHAALETVEGRGAYIEQIVLDGSQSPHAVVIRATAGENVPPLESVCPLDRSYTAHASVSGGPVLVPVSWDFPGRRVTDASAVAVVVPLGRTDAPTGALVITDPVHGRFRADDIAQAAIFGHLASLALEKVRILDLANEGRQRLEGVLKSRSRLIRGFSHDVKNPVGAADGYAALLADGLYGDLSARQADSVHRMRRSIRTALSLIDDLHELASAETGHLTMHLEAVDVAALLNTIAEEYQAAALAAGLAFDVELDSELPSVTTNAIRVRQIISNLVSNAIKYTPRGSVRMFADQRGRGPDGTPGRWLVVQVVDTGPGIPREKREFIFEEFSRIGDRTKPGAGLGLAISRLLARALGGGITIDGDVGIGSTFCLWLPLVAPDVEPAGVMAGTGSGAS